MYMYMLYFCMNITYTYTAIFIHYVLPYVPLSVAVLFRFNNIATERMETETLKRFMGYSTQYIPELHVHMYMLYMIIAIGVF